MHSTLTHPRTRRVHLVAALLGTTSLLACGDDGASRTPTDDDPPVPMTDGGAPAPIPDGGPAPDPDGGAPTDPDPALPAVESAAFVAYGVARLTFADAVDADAVTVALVDPRPSAPTVADWSQVDRATIEVRLERNHLSVDHTFAITPVDGGEGVEAFIAGEANGARVAFVTQAAGNGVIASWAGSSSDPLDAADELCNAEAEAAGLRGTFAAYLAIGGDAPTDATCRVVGHRGSYAESCGLAGTRGDDKAIVALDGRPIAQGADALAAGQVRGPVGYHADGSVASERAAWLGADESGVVLDDSCADWTSVSAANHGRSAVSLGSRALAGTHAVDCDATQSLVCVQLPEATTFTEADRHRRDGLKAFVTATSTAGNFGGLAAADQRCAFQAAEAGLPNAERFVAYLSDGSDDAGCRVQGGVGKLADGCTFFTDPPAAHPGWVAVDGSPVAVDPAALFAGELSAPLNVDATGLTIAPAEEVWTGTRADGSAMESTCVDWSSTSIYSLGIAGDSSSSADDWAETRGQLCFRQRRFYCFERP